MVTLLKNSQFNPLTGEEFEKYFSLLDTSKISDEQAEQIQTLLQGATEEEPYLLR